MGQNWCQDCWHSTFKETACSKKQNKTKQNKTKQNKKKKKKQLCKAKKIKKKTYVSKLSRAFIFAARLIQQNSRFEFFFACIIFYPVFLWTCLSKYTRKDMIDTMKHFEQQTSSILCSVLYLHPKASSIFQSCDRLKSDTYAAQKKKKKKR